MADTRVKTGKSGIAPNGGNDTLAFPRMTLDGATYDASWLQKMAAEGRMYTVQSGSGTAPNTFASTYTNTAPDLDLSNPAGQLVIPVALTVYFEAYGSSAQAEVVAAVGVGGVITPTSATAATPVNHRLDQPNNSGVTVVTDGTGGTYMTSSVMEFYRSGAQFAITKTSASATAASQDVNRYEWSATQSGIWPFMYNTASITRLNIFASSQAGTGFIILTFVVPDISGAVG